MKKKKSKKWLVVLLIVVLVGILIALINFSGSNSTDTSLNLTEKKWIENNKKDVINVSIANNIPAFSSEGDGVFFDFIDKVEEKTGLSFNLISYDAEDKLIKNDLYFEIVTGTDVNKLTEEEMVFFTDYYVLVSKKEDRISNPSNIINKSIGVLADELSLVSYYIPANSEITYTSFNEIDELQKGLEGNKVDYIAIPKTRYTDYIISNSYHVIYNITELKEAYVLRTNKEIDKNLKNIITKNYIDYKTNDLDSDYNKTLMDLYLSENNISEKAKADFLSKKYVFGYVDNKPYASVINNKLIGLDSTFLDSFGELTGASFSFKKYRSVKDLAKAFEKGKVDIIPSFYNYENLGSNYVATVSPYTEEYVVLVHSSKTDIVINSLRSLDNKEVKTVNMTLAKILEEDTKAKVNCYDRVESLIKDSDKKSIIVLDKNMYENFKEEELKEFHVLYTGSEDLSYGFLLRDVNENKTFSSLFNTYIELLNYKQLNNSAWKDYLVDSKEISYTYLYIMGAVVVLAIIFGFLRKNSKITKNIKREEAIRYVDPLTSLKNRNYLNKSFSSWENNAIYPQSIIAINLNNLRHVNDVYGHEEGDKLLRLAANILIKNQVDQSDIIRTDGNEFLIYMVGYEKNKVVSYMRKLYKELGELPYGYGATLGYSMIEDDIKTIDDAINEAVLEIRATKEMKSKGK